MASEDQVNGFVPKRHYNELPEAERPQGLVFEYVVCLCGQGDAFYYLLTEKQWLSVGNASDVQPGINALPANEVPCFASVKALVAFIQANGIVLKDDFHGDLY